MGRPDMLSGNAVPEEQIMGKALISARRSFTKHAIMAARRMRETAPDWHSQQRWKRRDGPRMIPISDDNPARRTPVVTWVLILACVLAFIWELSLGDAMDGAVLVFGFTPASLLPGFEAAPGMGQVSPALTIFTAMFLHGSVLHVLGNMLYLWIFGNNVEDAMGHVRYLVFYLLCGAAAALALAWMDPTSHLPMIGASGAISGVLAAYVLLFPRARILVIMPLGFIFFPFRVTALWVVGFWFFAQLVSAAATRPDQPGVAWWAHVGGFLIGAALTPLFKSRDFPLFGSPRLPAPRRPGPWD